MTTPVSSRCILGNRLDKRSIQIGSAPSSCADGSADLPPSSHDLSLGSSAMPLQMAWLVCVWVGGCCLGGWVGVIIAPSKFPRLSSAVAPQRAPGGFVIGRQRWIGRFPRGACSRPRGMLAFDIEKVILLCRLLKKNIAFFLKKT